MKVKGAESGEETASRQPDGFSRTEPRKERKKRLEVVTSPFWRTKTRN